MHLARAILIAALIAPAAMSAGDAELALSNGRTVRGEVVSDGPEGITLRLRSPVRGGVKQIDVVYAKADIVRKKDVPTPAQQYDERKARTPDTVPELCTLAQWCYENCLRDQAKAHALRVLELDPDSAWAKRILDNCGFIETDGKWVDESDYMKANNLAKVDGQLVPVAVAEARKALAKAVATRDRCAKQLQEAQSILAEKPGSAAAYEGKAKEQAAAAEAAKKAVDELDKKIDELSNQAGSSREDTERRRTQLDELRKRLGELQAKANDASKAAAEAKRLAGRDKSSAEQAKAKLPDLEAAMAKAVEEVKAAVAKLPADDPAAKAAMTPPKPPAPTEVKERAPRPPQGDKPQGRPPKDD